ncbi:Telomerase reverse transcriptase [Pelomyxa schiedti]|nr:Telomerase reverse transcriptase [Pelomyxa schiedti]
MNDVRSSTVTRSTLGSIFPYGKLLTLYEFLCGLYEEGGGLINGKLPPFLKSGDGMKYRNLLFHTIVGEPSFSPHLSGINLNWRQHCSMSEVIRRVVTSSHRLTSSTAASDNLLSMGLDVTRDTPRGIKGIDNLNCSYANPFHVFLMRNEFRLLLERVGDTALTFLLRHYCVFRPLPNRCYIQIAGVHVASVVQNLKSRLQTTVHTLMPLRKSLSSLSQTTLSRQPLIYNQNGNHLRISSSSQAQQSQEWLKQHKTIPRMTLFYSQNSRRRGGLPHSHILNSLKSASTSDARKLIRKIFYGSTVSGKRDCPYFHMIPVFQRLLKKQATCKYNTLLHFLGSKAVKDRSKSKASVPQAMSDLLKQYSPHGCVFRFIKAVLDHVIPLPLWGSVNNKKMFLKHLKKFISLRIKEQMCLSHIMQGIKLNDCKWLDSKQIREKRSTCRPPPNYWKRKNIALGKWLFWLFTEFIIPVLRSHYYCTETTVHKNKVFYWRQSIWRKISQLGFRTLTATIYKSINKDTAKVINGESTFPTATCRLLPKVSDTRPIVNLGKKSPTGGPSTNSQLKNLHTILTFEKTRHHDLMGFSLLSPLEAYGKFLPFLQQTWKAQPYYFVSVDIKNCFNSLNQTTLLKEAEGFLSQDEYLIQRFVVANVNWKKGTPVLSWKKIAHQSTPVPQFLETAKKYAATHRNSVLADQVVNMVITRKKALMQLKHHISQTIVQHGSELYHQATGIPQGSILSTLLCSISYGHLENEKFRSLLDIGPGLILRMIDDTFVISSSKELIQEFLRRISPGFADHGYFVNQNKCTTNLPNASFADGTPVPQVTPSLEGKKFMPWCGYIFDTQTLEVRLDYERFASSNFVNTMSIEYTSHPGESMLSSFLNTISIKLSALLVDPFINSTFTIALNVYQLFMFCAIKFHCYCLLLPEGINKNPKFLHKVVLDTIWGMHQRIKCLAEVIPKSKPRFQPQQRPNNNIHQPLTVDECTWLGLHAFTYILTKKRGHHTSLLHYLQKQMRHHTQHKTNSTKFFHVVMPSFSAAFEKMKY